MTICLSTLQHTRILASSRISTGLWLTPMVSLKISTSGSSHWKTVKATFTRAGTLQTEKSSWFSAKVRNANLKSKCSSGVALAASSFSILLRDCVNCKSNNSFLVSFSTKMADSKRKFASWLKAWGSKSKSTFKRTWTKFQSSKATCRH